MTTSGSYDFSLNRNAIITLALQLINIVDLDTTPDSSDITAASNILNGMVKVWETEGIRLWKRRIGYIFTTFNDYSYELGSVSGADHCTNTYVSTTLTAAAASSATSLTVSSTTGMTASDNIGITLDNGTRFWTTISVVNSSTSLTIASGLTSAAASGNFVVTYTSKINRPLKILRSTLINLSTNTESLMSPLSFDEYFNLPNKTTAGDPLNFYYDKLISNAIPHTGTLYVFPRPNNVDRIIACTYQDSIQDFDSSSDDADFPQEWVYPLAFNLACELAYFYGKFQELQAIQPKADALKATMNNFDSDNDSLRIGL